MPSPLSATRRSFAVRRISTRPAEAGTALAISLAAFGFGAAPALAATAAVSSTTLIVAGDAAHDVLTVSNPGAGTFVIDSAAPIEPLSPECAAQSANRVTCTSAAITRLSIRGDAGDDTITNDTGFRSNIQGGAGDDSLTGGSGDDSITGETGLDTADGRAGDDVLFMKGTLVDRVTC